MLRSSLFEQIAMEKFSEATVGYNQNKSAADRWVQLFCTPYFNVTAVSNKVVKNLEK